MVAKCVSLTSIILQVPGGDQWDTIDVRETMKQAEADGVHDGRSKVQAFMKDLYSKNPNGKNTARDHSTVINSFRQAQNLASGCGRGSSANPLR